MLEDLGCLGCLGEASIRRPSWDCASAMSRLAGQEVAIEISALASSGKESQYQNLEDRVVLIVRSLRYHNHIAAVT